MSEEAAQTGTETVVDSSTTTESSASTAAAASDATAAKSAGSAADDGTAGIKDASVAVPAWQPNYKFTVKDKELEFDEWVRPVIKDKDTEEKLRDLYSKAHGLEEVKADRQTLKEKYAQIEERSSKIDQSLKVLGDYVKAGDYRSFFEALRIPKEQVIQYAVNELKYLELPQEERNRIEQERAMKAQLAQYEEQTMTLQEQHDRLVAQQVGMELSSEMARPEVAQIISSFDTRVGKPGAFHEEVLKRGAYYEAVHKTSPPAKQLVDEVVRLAGLQMAQDGNPAITQQQVAPTGTPATAGKKPVIPNFNGSGSASPTRKVVSSIADLKKIREDLVARG